MKELRVGNPKEWAPFGERNRLFLERFERLEEAINALFHRTLAPPTPAFDLLSSTPAASQPTIFSRFCCYAVTPNLMGRRSSCGPCSSESSL